MIKRILFTLFTATTGLMAAIGAIVTYQSVITGKVITDSLNRHAEQRFIERATRDIVLEELNTLHLWLGINSLMLFILLAVVLWLLLRPRIDHRDGN